MMSEERDCECPFCGTVHKATWYKPPKKTEKGYLIVEGECPNCGLEYKGHGHMKED